MKQKVAILGVGLMGEPMGRRLLLAGKYQVSVWNRTAGKCRALVAQGARLALTPVDAAQDAQFVIIMLADGPAVEGVLFGQGVDKNLKAGATVVDMGSNSPATARDHADRLRDSGVHHLDAPVSGGTAGAMAGTLAIMAGGEQEVFERVLPLFRHLGRATLVGPSGAGQIAKLANQMIVGVTINAVAEALFLAGTAGADIAKVREALSGGFADSTILQAHGQRMLERNWTPGAPVRIQLKDLRNALSLADEHRLVLPTTSAAAQLYEAAVNAGLAEHDHSAALLALEMRRDDD